MDNNILQYKQDKEINTLICDIESYIETVFTQKIAHNINFKELDDGTKNLKELLEAIKNQFSSEIRGKGILLDKDVFYKIETKFMGLMQDDDVFFDALEPLINETIEDKLSLLDKVGVILMELHQFLLPTHGDTLKTNKEVLTFGGITFTEGESVSFGDFVINKENYNTIKTTYQQSCNKDNQSEFMIGLRILYSILKSGKRLSDDMMSFNIEEELFLTTYLAFSKNFPFARSHKESKCIQPKYIGYARNLLKKYESHLLHTVIIPDRRQKANKTLSIIQIIS